MTPKAPLSEWKEPVQAEDFQEEGKLPPPAAEGSRSGRRRSKKGGKKKQAKAALAGWIACLFLLGIAAGIWSWAEHLRDRLKLAETEVGELRNSIVNLQKVANSQYEMVPPGEVRGIVTYEPAPRQLAVMSGATVGIFPREVIEKALRDTFGTTEFEGTEKDFDQSLDKWRAALPSPAEVTLTDANGRFTLPATTPGEYVVVANASRPSPTGIQRTTWIIGVVSDDQPSRLILLSDRNSASAKNPKLGVRSPQSLH